MVKKELIDLNDVFPEVEFTDLFISHYSKRLKSGNWKKKVRIHIKKIICDPYVGKSMKHTRKGTREIYINDSFRLSYCYSKETKNLLFLTIYPKKKQKKK